MPKFTYTVEVEADTLELANTVMCARIYEPPEQEYGFNYTVQVIDNEGKPWT